MKTPLLDILGFTVLLFAVSRWPFLADTRATFLPAIDWILQHEPLARACSSYGAAFVVAWRAWVLSRRAYARIKAKREAKKNELSNGS